MMLVKMQLLSVGGFFLGEMDTGPKSAHLIAKLIAMSAEPLGIFLSENCPGYQTKCHNQEMIKNT